MKTHMQPIFKRYVKIPLTPSSCAYQSFSDEEFFKLLDNVKGDCRLIKIHGSIDNVDSTRTTLSTIANRKLSDERDKTIERIFGSKDEFQPNIDYWLQLFRYF